MTIGLVTRYPNPRHWMSLQKKKPMTPEDFLKFWEVDYAEMAKICYCSIDTVNHWFAEGSSKRAPKPHHLALLRFTHEDWLRVSKEPIHADIFRQAAERRRNKENK